MSKKAEVYLRVDGKKQMVNMTSDDKPEVTSILLEKWQVLINILATMMDVNACLINQLLEKKITVLLRSDNLDDPYTVGLSDSLGQGVYCEMVVGKKEAFEINNAKKDMIWKDSQYTQIGMISYFGLPLLWPDGEVFGTLSVIDHKENHFSRMFKDIFTEFKSSIEKDLEIFMTHTELKTITEQDGLTQVYNRRKIESSFESEFDRSKRTNHEFSIILLDLDNFKSINETYGHRIGDQILILFSKLVKQQIRKTDIIGRWGSDEFLIICPSTSYKGAHSLITKMRSNVMYSLIKLVREANYSFGTAVYKGSDKHSEDIIKRAYAELIDNKEKNRVE